MLKRKVKSTTVIFYRRTLCGSGTKGSVIKDNKPKKQQKDEL